MDAPFIFKDKAADDDRMEEEEEDSYDGEFLFKKKKLVSASGSGKKGSGPSCQAERCVADLSDAKRYLLRHSVCQVHVKASVVTVAGLCQSFCQQCSRFHELSEFDDTKRSCRERLAGHNKRRRKGLVESHAEGSGRRQNQPREADNRRETWTAFPGTPTCKQLHVRGDFPFSPCLLSSVISKHLVCAFQYCHPLRFSIVTMLTPFCHFKESIFSIVYD